MMRVDARDVSRSAGSASIVALSFAVVLAVLALVRPSSAEQFRSADPLVRLLGSHAAWLVVAATVAIALSWRATLAFRSRDVAWALGGAAVAVSIALTVRGLAGPRLPRFVPTEEGSLPGITFG